MGRTGTLIAIDTILEQVKQEKMVNVAGVITKMRHQRMKMVQTAVSDLMNNHYHQLSFQCLMFHRISSYSYMM